MWKFSKHSLLIGSELSETDHLPILNDKGCIFLRKQYKVCVCVCVYIYIYKVHICLLYSNSINKTVIILIYNYDCDDFKTYACDNEIFLFAIIKCSGGVKIAFLMYIMMY
jgi:hypothetical protein